MARPAARMCVPDSSSLRFSMQPSSSCSSAHLAVALFLELTGSLPSAAWHTDHFKFRFWYQEYRAEKNSHKKIGAGWGSNLGAGGGGLGAEFDVPKCDVGVPGCSKDEDGTWVHTVVGVQKANLAGLVAAHMHCMHLHACRCR